MRKYIDNYCIVYVDPDVDINDVNAISTSCHYYDGFRTLPTMRKRFNSLKYRYSNFKDCHVHFYLVSRDYPGNVVKVYDELFL